MSDKVKLTKEQAQTIGYFKESDDWTEVSLVEAHAFNINRWEDSASPINGMPLDTLIRALYIGYEVEQTPEARLLLDYEHCHEELIDAKTKDSSAYWSGRKEGIVTTLAILNIKVKGINA